MGTYKPDLPEKDGQWGVACPCRQVAQRTPPERPKLFPQGCSCALAEDLHPCKTRHLRSTLLLGGQLRHLLLNSDTPSLAEST